MDRQNNQNKIDELCTCAADLLHRAASEVKIYLNHGAKRFFATYPSLTSFGWRQHAPFEVEPQSCPALSGAVRDVIVIDGMPYLQGTEPSVLLRAAADEVRTLLHPIPDNILIEAFDDETEITILRDLSIQVRPFWPYDETIE